MIQEEAKTVTLVLSPQSAQRLADWYLPVVFRDFFLGMHPLMQTYLYRQARGAAEFFTNVQMEAARHKQLRRFAWHESMESNEAHSNICLIPLGEEKTKLLPTP